MLWIDVISGDGIRRIYDDPNEPSSNWLDKTQSVMLSAVCLKLLNVLDGFKKSASSVNELLKTL